MENNTNLDILIKNGTIVTMDENRRILKNGVIGISGSEIQFVLPESELPLNLKSKQTFDAYNQVIIPGLINAHGHMAMTLFRGLVEDLKLDAWLEKVWKYELSTLTPEGVRAGSKLAILEMIKSGTTAAHDMYWHYMETMDLCEEVGFRLLSGPPITKIGGQDFNEMIQEARDTLTKLKPYKFVESIIQAHSTYTTNPQLLNKAREIKEEFGVVFHTHASETANEVSTVINEYGKPPVEVFHSFGLLDKNTILAHCVHLHPHEIDILAETGTHVAHNPESNLKLGSGIADISTLVKRNINICLGTDGAASNNDLSLLDEMRTASLLQKGLHQDPEIFSTQYAFEMVTVNGARAYGLDHKIGSLEAGKKADIVMLDFDQPHLTPCIDIYANLVYSASKSDITTVIIDGEVKYQHGEFLPFDTKDLFSEIQTISNGFGV